jgi:hypothetical protein
MTQEVLWDLPLSDQGMDSEMLENLNNLGTDYWVNARKFVYEIADRKFSTLTINQQNYALDIIAYLRVDTNRKISKFLSKGDNIGNWHEVLRYHSPLYLKKVF